MALWIGEERVYKQWRSIARHLGVEMRTRATACGVVGGALALVAAVVALLTGGADTVIVGAWLTVAAAALGIVGCAMARARPALAALSMGLAFVVAGLVAPGVIPAIADTTLVLFGYFAAVVLLLAGTILAYVDRRGPVTTG